MKLLYIYIDRYKNIQNTGFNLSSDYQIEFNGNEENPLLQIQKNDTGIPYLFHENFLDVKGIVGENGAGKSNLLEFLYNECTSDTYLMNEFFGSYISKRLMVYEGKPGEVKIVAASFWKAKLASDKIKCIGNFKFNYSTNFKISINKEVSFNDIDQENKNLIIYYSNIFDQKQSYQSNDLINLSTNYLVYNDIVSKYNNAEIRGQANAHRLMELERQFDFVVNFKDELPFNLRSFFEIQITSIYVDILNKEKTKYDKGPEIPENSFLNRIDSWILFMKKEHDSSNNSFLSVLERMYFTYFIYNDILPRSTRIGNHDKLSFRVFDLLIESVKKVIDYNELIENIKIIEGDFIYDSQDNRKVLFSYWSEKIIAFGKFKDRLKELLSEVDGSDNYPVGKRIFLLENGKEILDLYGETLSITGYLEISLPELSSGELGFLTLFARFNSLNNKHRFPNKEIDKYSSLLILIDEGDLYFHPKWQVQFINYLNQMFPKIFAGKKIQVIVTSHSQFIASDLPSNHLLFLRKGKDGLCEIDDGLDKTFAANIHELLSSAFFIEGAHIGAFAKSIIHKILDQMALGDNNEIYTNDELKALIDIVGEPWVRSQLLEKYELFNQQDNQ